MEQELPLKTCYSEYNNTIYSVGVFKGGKGVYLLFLNHGSLGQVLYPAFQRFSLTDDFGCNP